MSNEELKLSQESDNIVPAKKLFKRRLKRGVINDDDDSEPIQTVEAASKYPLQASASDPMDADAAGIATAGDKTAPSSKVQP